MNTLFVMLATLTLNYSLPAEGTGITLQPIIQALDTELGGTQIFRYVPQLDNQAASCAIWLLANPTKKIDDSPQIKNKDPNVVFVTERYYRNHKQIDNVKALGLMDDPLKRALHSKDYEFVNEVDDAVCEDILNSAWLKSAIQEAGVRGIGGAIKGNDEYFLTVFALYVPDMAPRLYKGILPRHEIPPLSLEPLKDEDFKFVPLNKLEVEGISLNPSGTQK